MRTVFSQAIPTEVQCDFEAAPNLSCLSYDVVETRQKRDINYIGRLIYFLSKPYAGNADHNPNTAYISVSPTPLTTSMRPVSIVPCMNSSAYASMFVGLTTCWLLT